MPNAMNNYINIDKVDYEKKIFRIFTIDRLIEMFENKKNTLVKPELWDDPFENFILNIPRNATSGKVYKSVLRNRIYGQCWTLNIESDAMWRIYSPEKNGVKICSTIRKLFTSLKNAQESYRTLSCFIGKVTYLTNKEIMQFLSDGNTNQNQYTTSIEQARTLLFKRKPFKHENEIRLLYLDPHNQAESNEYCYTCDPFSLVDLITFDPRMSPTLYNIYKKYLKEIGYTKKIIQSSLYRPPNFE